MIDFSLLNKINLRCFYKSFFILVNPLRFYIYICFPSKSKVIKVRTPIGKVNICMRNRQSARTLYSIFVREDYLIDNKPKNILDLGSNIGISAIYFLTRNIKNRIFCVEPDPNNHYFIERNLNKFSDRSKISFCAIRSKNEENKYFNLSKDGKYSSFNEIGANFDKKIKVETLTINDALKDDIFNNNFPILIKIDIEGLEKEVINNFDFNSNLRIKQLIAEGTGYKEYINRAGVFEIRNGYVEKYTFIENPRN